MSVHNPKEGLDFLAIGGVEDEVEIDAIKSVSGSDAGSKSVSGSEAGKSQVSGEMSGLMEKIKSMRNDLGNVTSEAINNLADEVCFVTLV
ncbi:hypothetical protein HK101_004833 [Irineochytrium annulatum]|nr:hypothetical protein HK101_004833 [Irineochytrium annulatum]